LWLAHSRHVVRQERLLKQCHHLNASGNKRRYCRVEMLAPSWHVRISLQREAGSSHLVCRPSFFLLRRIPCLVSACGGMGFCSVLLDVESHQTVSTDSIKTVWMTRDGKKTRIRMHFAAQRNHGNVMCRGGSSSNQVRFSPMIRSLIRRQCPLVTRSCGHI
jgi:hypothetical protein